MKTISQELENAIEVMADENQLITENELQALSDMTEEEFDAFYEKWKTVDATRRQQVICILHDEADDNTSYDFSRIYRLCLRDKDDDVRYEAIRSIWESRDTSLIMRLSKIVMEDNCQDVREAAAEALGNFALMNELEDLDYGTELENTLLSVYYNETEFDSIRCQALIAVAPLTSTGVQKAIEEAFKKDDLTYKCAAICAMGRNTDDVWIPIINATLENEDNHELKIAAIRAAGEIEDEAFIPYLATLMIERDSEVLLEAIIALGKIGTLSAKQAILTQTNVDDPKIQEAIQNAFENISNRQSPLSYEINLGNHQHIHHEDDLD